MTGALLLAAVALVVAVRLRRRRPSGAVLRSESLLTLHGGLAKKQSARKKAALDAASAALR